MRERRKGERREREQERNEDARDAAVDRLVRARHQYPTGLRCFALVFSRRTVTLVLGITQFAVQGYCSYNINSL